MLIMKPGCERCDVDLPADQEGAWICSFECTFCTDCSTQHLRGACPNCGGALCERPTRAQPLWQKFPPSSERIFNPQLAASEP